METSENLNRISVANPIIQSDELIQSQWSKVFIETIWNHVLTWIDSLQLPMEHLLVVLPSEKLGNSSLHYRTILNRRLNNLSASVSISVDDFAEDIKGPILPILDALGLIGGNGDDLELGGVEF